MCSFGGGVSWCPLVWVCRLFECSVLARVLWWCAPCLLSACLLCACRVACKYGSISRFEGVFSGFWGVGVYLYRFGVLRGLCGFCARVELGGYMTCGVFASILSLLPMFYLLRPCFISFASVFLLLRLSFVLFLVLFAPAFFACPLVLSLCRLLFLFPLRMYAQKERAQSVVLCVLSQCFVQSFKFL